MQFSWVRELLTWRVEKGHGSCADWDSKYGTETRASATLETLTICHDTRRYGERYQASDPRVLLDSIKFMGLTPSKYRFIDLGCGKGRMLIVAAECGFKSCIGVVFADELAELAAKNVAVSGFKNVGIVHGDAGNYSFKDDQFVLYMFNPFSKQVMERVRNNLLKLNEAKYYVIYKNAKERCIFDEMKMIRYIGSPPTQKGLYGVHIWVPRD